MKNIMKKSNHLILIVALATIVAGFSARACECSACSKLTDNAALLSSPRYREIHPELSLQRPFDQTTSARKTQRMEALSQNVALASSPRFREEHPDLRVVLSAEYSSAVSQLNRMEKLTDNLALAASPRYREEHPELLVSEPVFEIAPLK
jgi:flagellar basal body rod protein FlgC